MSYTNEWFDITGKANFEKYLSQLKGRPGLKVLEVGCYEGRATVWLLENILTDKTSKITVVDTFGGGMEHNEEGIEMDKVFNRFMENILPHKDKVFIYKGNSGKILPTMNYEFDFIYIDGSHQAPDVLEDAINGFRLLKAGGLMIFDDYQWHKYENPNLNPGPGIDAFLKVFSDKIEVLKVDYQVVITKK